MYYKYCKAWFYVNCNSKIKWTVQRAEDYDCRSKWRPKNGRKIPDFSKLSIWYLGFSNMSSRMLFEIRTKIRTYENDLWVLTNVSNTLVYIPIENMRSHAGAFIIMAACSVAQIPLALDIFQTIRSDHRSYQ